MDKNIKAWIDNASYEELLRRWRFTPANDPMFKGDTYDYYMAKMREKRSPLGEQHVSIRKRREK